MNQAARNALSVTARWAPSSLTSSHYTDASDTQITDNLLTNYEKTEVNSKLQESSDDVLVNQTDTQPNALVTSLTNGGLTVAASGHTLTDDIGSRRRSPLRLFSVHCLVVNTVPHYNH